VALRAGGAKLALLRAYAAMLPELFIVSSVDVAEREGGGEELAIEVVPATATKCARCWNRRADVGRDPAHADVCGRCASVLTALEKK
jgi:isoleucyl-tRNA synthetase